MLSSRVAMIESGNEALDGSSWDREIVDYDIEPENSEHFMSLKGDWT
jgi:hypothetical protein